MSTKNNQDHHEEEFEFEEEIEEVDAIEPKDKLKKLREKLKACEAEKQDYLDGWQRIKADVVNMHRSHQDDVKRAEEKGREKLIEAVAPVLDSFDMAMTGEAWENVDATWREGVEGIHTHFTKTLEKNGLSVIDPVGEVFNPYEHESVSIEHTDDAAQDHTVTTTLQKGLKVGERVIRPAKVVVAQFNG